MVMPQDREAVAAEADAERQRAFAAPEEDKDEGQEPEAEDEAATGAHTTTNETPMVDSPAGVTPQPEAPEPPYVERDEQPEPADEPAGEPEPPAQ